MTGASAGDLDDVATVRTIAGSSPSCVPRDNIDSISATTRSTPSRIV